MTDEILTSLAGLFSLQSIIGFCFGVGSTVFYYWIADRKDRKVCQSKNTKSHPSKINQLVHHPLLVLWTFLFVLAAFLGFQQYTTARDVRILAQETQSCQVEFNQVIRARDKLNDMNDKLNQDTLINMEAYLNERLNPPDEIRALQRSDPDWPSNPQFLQWELEVNRDFYDEIKDISDQKAKVERDRAEVPLPEPTCGK